MKSDIELLIEHLRNEKIYLETEMNKCALDRHFDDAELYVKPLGIVNQKLGILQLIEPNHQLEIDSLKQQIDRLKKLSKNDSELIKDSVWRRIEQLQIRIIEFQQPNEKKSIDSPIIDDALFELLNREYSILRFYLESQESNLELSLISNTQMIFCFKSFSLKQKPFWESWYLSTFFKKLGFEKNDVNSTLELNLELNNFSFLEIKSLLALIFFEGIISYRKANNQYFIEKI